MKNAIIRLIGEGHRVFFLAAGLYAIFALIVWEGWIGIHAAGGMVSDMPFAPPPHLWHAHELVFGYPAAAMGGFFLTAVPNWTGARAARHTFIACAAGLWLAGRIAVWYSGSLPPVAVALVDLAFLPLLAAKVLTQLLNRPKPQNMMFLGLLTMIWSGNLLVHLEWTGVAYTLDAGLRLGLYATCALIAVLGGRVTPAFTRNAMQREGQARVMPGTPMPLNVAGIALPILVALAAALPLPGAVFGALALGAGVAQGARSAMWRPGWTWNQPILWVLHLGMAALALGYVLAGLAAFGIGSEVAALHVLGIGAVGGMTLGVMSRAALGHSGLPLIAPGPLALAYALLPVSMLARWVGSSLGIEGYYAGVLISGAVWIAVFTLYTTTLWPVFWGERPPRGSH